MKMINRIYIGFILVLLSYNTIEAQKQKIKSIRSTKFESIDAFAIQIFDLIKANDTVALQSFIMCKDDSHDLFDKVVVPKNKSKAVIIENFEKNAQSFLEYFMSDYRKLLKEITSMGIDLPHSQLEFIDFKHTRTINVEQADIEINFSYQNKVYNLILEGCPKSKSTWLLGVKVRIVVSDFQQSSQLEMSSPDKGWREETPVKN